MSGIGGITYGQSQYANSGSKFFGNKFFKEHLYFKEERSFLTTFFYTELLALTESFATHLAILWERFTENLSVAHTIAQVSISKILIEILAITNPATYSFGLVFKDFIKALDSIGYFVRNSLEFKEVIRILHKEFLTIRKSWKESFSAVESGLQRISGFIHRDYISVLHKIPVVSIKHVYTFFLKLTGSVRRKIDGVSVGWTKSFRPTTVWNKGDRTDTDWEKTVRKDI